VVEADPFEKNKRQILNYGHTIGHAVEAASDYRLLHGEAVAIGIVGAGLIEEQMGFAQQGRLERIIGMLNKLAVPIAIPDSITKDDMLELLRHDKKAVAGQPRFVLLDKIGSVHVEGSRYSMEVEPEMVQAVVNLL